MSKTVCFTGHRPKALCGYNADAYRSFVKELALLCDKLCKKGYETFITGGAQGVDQLTFWAVYKIKSIWPNIKNNLYIPFSTFGEKWPETGTFSKAEYKMITDSADTVKIIGHDPSNTTEMVSAMMNRNHAMIDDSDLLIAVYENDYSWKTDKGGTAEAIRYAKSKGKPVMFLIYNAQEIQNLKMSFSPLDCELRIINTVYDNNTAATVNTASNNNSAATAVDDYLLVSSPVWDKNEERRISALSLHINKNRKFVVSAEDHDGHEWFAAESIESVINSMLEENAEYIFNLLKERLDR